MYSMIESCPRIDKCSATKCPADSDVNLRRHLEGDPICLYLLQYAKGSNSPSQSAELHKLIHKYFDYLFSSTGRNEKGLYDIRSRLYRASTQPKKTVPWEAANETS